MLRFGPGVFCRVFRLELALVLHHAAVWALLTRVPVDVNSLADRKHGAKSQHPYDCAVDLDTAGDRLEHARQLGEYLSRVLGPHYDIVIESDHVHVEFDAGRAKTEISQIWLAPGAQ